MLTCSPAGQHILSTSVGLAGQTEPFCPPPPTLTILIWAAGVGASLVAVLGGGGGDRQTFSVESHFPVVSSSVFFRCSHCKRLKGEEKASNRSTCGTSVTWLFPFQTPDLCLPAKTQDAGSRGRREAVGWGGGRERFGQSGNAEDGGEDYAKCRPLLNMSLLSVKHARSQTSVQIFFFSAEQPLRWDLGRIVHLSSGASAAKD